MTANAREKILHCLFLVSVWIKGGAGLLEIIAGIPFFALNPGSVAAFVLWLTAPELAEDPSDWLANTIRRSVHHLSADATLFAGVYLVVHGAIKLFLVAGLLRRRLWAYPISLWFIAAFIVYQSYRFMYTHSLWLVTLTVFDLIVAFLIWHEYQSRKRMARAESFPQ
jgi:uncharacterized membrane protein